MSLRRYARLAASLLLALGLGGLFGLLPYAEDLGTVLYHIGVGLIFAYVGFGRRLDEQMVRQVVGGFGALIVGVKATLTLAPLLWGGPLLFDGVEFTCVIIGPFSLLAAAYLPDQHHHCTLEGRESSEEGT